MAAPMPVTNSNMPGDVPEAGALAPTLRLYARTLIRVAGRPVTLAVAVAFLATLAEGVGIALIIPLLQVAGFRLDEGGKLSHYAVACQRLLEASGVPRSWWLALLLMVFVALVALRSLLNRSQSVLTLSAVLRFGVELTRELYSAILNANWPFLSRRRSS